MLKAGIVGLPNVGKSTLFNALIRSHKAAAANYPFCTIEPNLGVVTVPDARLDAIAQVATVNSRIPTTIEFLDIAGLVKGASQGEGLGNKFLSHIREVDAIIHVTGGIEPVRDIEIVMTELVLADLEAIRRRREKIVKELKGGEKHGVAENHVLDKLEAHLNAGKPANTAGLFKEEHELIAACPLLTDKPTVFSANVKEGQLGGVSSDPQVAKVRHYARIRMSASATRSCATSSAAKSSRCCWTWRARTTERRGTITQTCSRNWSCTIPRCSNARVSSLPTKLTSLPPWRT